jgi:hypothetical protein
MAVAISSLDHAGTNGATTTVTTASISPAANSTLVLFVSNWDGGSANTPVVTAVSGLSLTWVQLCHTTAGGVHGDLSCWIAVCGSSPGSGTITITTGSNITGGNCYDVIQVTGGVVIGNSTKFATTTGTSPNITMGTAAASDSRFIYGQAAMLVSGGSNAVTPAGSWTELNDFYNAGGGPGGVSLETQYSPDSTSTAASGTWSVSRNGMAICIEVGTLPAGTPQLRSIGQGSRLLSTSASLGTSWNHQNDTSDAQTIAILAAVFSINSNNTGTTTSATCGGNAMTQLGSVEVGSSTNRACICFFSKVNPGTGDITMAVASAGTPTKTAVMAQSLIYTNTSGASGFTNAATTGLTVTTAAGDVAVIVTSNGVTLATANKNVRYSDGGSITGIGDFMVMQDAVASGSSVAFTNSGTASTPESMGVSLGQYTPPAGGNPGRGFFGLMAA